VETTLEFLVVRHIREGLKSTNSGRLAGLVIPSCKVLDYGVAQRPFDEGLLAGAAWLLFPPEMGEDSRPTGRHELIRGTDQAPPGPIVVLDGTWGQARRMSHRLKCLDALPRYQLEPGPAPRRRVRRSPRPGMMSTIEAILRMVGRFDDPAKAEALEDAYFQWGKRARLVRPEEGLAEE
jgi:DTW domain-containing protein YfiP